MRFCLTLVGAQGGGAFKSRRLIPILVATVAAAKAIAEIVRRMER
jgi:hypothetical protein